MSSRSSVAALAASAAGAAGSTTAQFYKNNHYGRFGGTPPAWNSAGSNNGMRTNAATQVAIALNAQVGRRVVAGRIAQEQQSAVLSNYRSMSQSPRGLEDVVTGMLVFRQKKTSHVSGGRRSRAGPRGSHATVPTVWAAFNFISTEELIEAVFVGVADGTTFAENMSVGPHDKRLAVCVWGMRTIKNTGGRTIRRGRTVVWGAPYVRPGPGNTVQQEHTFQGVSKELLTASVWPLEPGQGQMNAGVIVQRMLVGNSTTEPELVPHITNAAKWAKIGGVYAANKDDIIDGRTWDSAALANQIFEKVEDGQWTNGVQTDDNGGADQGFLGPKSTEQLQVEAVAETLVTAANNYAANSKVLNKGFDGMAAAIFQRCVYEISQYYKAVMCRRIGVAMSDGAPGEDFDILLSY